MVRSWYFYALSPVVIVVGTAVLLTIPYLAVVVLAAVVLVLVAALAWAAVFLPIKLGRAIGRRWSDRSGAWPAQTPALAPVRPQHGELGRVR